MDGKFNIDPAAIENYTRALKFNKEESHFFRHLVLLNQAKTSEERQIHAKELLKSRTFRKLHPLSGAQYAYLSHWYFVPVRELIGMPGFKEDPQWIAQKISPAISVQEVKKAIEELLKLNLIERNVEGRLVQKQGNLSVGQGVTSPFLAQWHREMLKKASESIDRHPREVRDITTATIAMSEDSMKTVKEIIERCRREILEVSSKDSTPNLIYQINFQLFPLSDSINEKTEAAHDPED